METHLQLPQLTNLCAPSGLVSFHLDLNYFPGRNSQGGVVLHVLWLVLAPLPILSCHTSQYRINIFQRTVKKVRNRKISGYVLKKTHSRAATV